MSQLTSESIAGAQQNWDLWSTYAVLVVPTADELGPARSIVNDVTAAVGNAVSRFRTDTEISRVNTAEGGWVDVSPDFINLLTTALRIAEATDGLVDPMIGSVLVALGYDKDISDLRASGSRPTIAVRSRTTWLDVEIDQTGRVRIPAGSVLDLGATAKAWASDRAASRIHSEVGCPVLVGLGGDMAVAGVPEGNPGFVVRIVERPEDSDGPLLALPQGGLATSSTLVRRWKSGGREVHHVIDPRTAAPAQEFWRTVSVVGNTCVDANAGSTAAIILGDGAVEWLRGQGLPARLAAADGSITRVPPWPEEV